MRSNFCYYLGFSHFLGIGPIKLKELIKHFGTVKKAYYSDFSEKFSQFRQKFDFDKKLNDYKRRGISVICWEDKNYPKLLKLISDPPICLYLRGEFDFSKYKNYFAVVGTRNPTSYGCQVAKMFTCDLVDAGFVVVSGLAKGIDGIVHQTAVDISGKTVAVLGCGVDVIYPAENRCLYNQILKKGGLIISEFPPGRLVQKGFFIARNRIISGLSQGVMVVEGLKNSGSLITARYAADQGREVFASPAPITSKMSEAPNLLLKEGAKMVTGVEDIFEELNIKVMPREKENILEQLADAEKNIYELIVKIPRSADEISRTKKISIEKVLNLLSLLEIKGVVEKDKNGKYNVKVISR